MPPTSPVESATLADLLKAQDPLAMVLILQACGDQARCELKVQFGLSDEEAHDVLVDALLHVLKSGGQYQPGQRLWPWFRQAVVHAAQDGWRRRRRRRECSDQVDDRAASPPDEAAAGTGPTAQDLEDLRACVEQLPPRDRTIVCAWAADKDGTWKTAPEVADLGKTNQYLRGRLLRIFAQLRKMMDRRRTGRINEAT
jgi:DNA-directed RNA polymerase specialized sigma24 family protein